MDRKNQMSHQTQSSDSGSQYPTAAAGQQQQQQQQSQELRELMQLQQQQQQLQM